MMKDIEPKKLLANREWKMEIDYTISNILI